MYLEILSRNIRELREKKGLTQKEFADSLSVSDKTVSKWENCRSMPDIVMLKKLAIIYKVSIDALVGIQKIKK